LDFTDGALVNASFFDATFPYLKTRLLDRLDRLRQVYRCRPILYCQDLVQFRLSEHLGRALRQFIPKHPQAQKRLWFDASFVPFDSMAMANIGGACRHGHDRFGSNSMPRGALPAN